MQFQYLKPQQTYEDHYDLGTIKERLEQLGMIEEVGRKLRREPTLKRYPDSEHERNMGLFRGRMLFIIKAQRFKQRDSIIKAWMDKDQIRQHKQDDTPPPQMEYSFPYASTTSRDFIVEVVSKLVKATQAIIANPSSETNQSIAEVLTQFPDANKAFMLGHIYVPVLIDGPLSIIQALLILNNGTMVDAEEIVQSGMLLDFTRRMRVNVLGANASAGWMLKANSVEEMRDFCKQVVEQLQLEKAGRYQGYVDDVFLATHRPEGRDDTILEKLALQFVLPMIRGESVL